MPVGAAWPMMIEADLDALRERLRSLRRVIPPEQQRKAGESLLAMVRELECFRLSERLAFYLPTHGEASPEPLLAHALGQGKHCCLPRVLGAGAMEFIAYRSGDRLLTNSWGIPEPVSGERIEPALLDLALVPLVGFSQDCKRLGNGKGYYDRVFAFCLESPAVANGKWDTAAKKPILLGLAHECQLLESLPVRAWDVPLDAVATPARIYWRGKDG